MITRLLPKKSVLLFFTVFLLNLLTQASLATEFTLTSLNDTRDENPGDCICSDGNTCTLRAAIMESNACLGDDTVILGPGTHELTIDESDEDAALSKDLDITATVHLQGWSSEKTIIDANLLDRAFEILGGNVTLSGMTIQNGKLSADDTYGGAIYVNATADTTALTLSDVVLTNNTAPSGAAIKIDVPLTFTVTDSSFEDNTANADTGGIVSQSGGDSVWSEVTVYGNASEGTGIIVVDNATLTFTDVTIEQNVCRTCGIFYFDSSTGTLANNAFERNTSLDSHAAIHVYGSSADSELTITETNFNENIGGAIALNDTSATLTITDSSFSNNETSNPGAAIFSNGGSVIYVSGSTFQNNTSESNGGAIATQDAAGTLTIASSKFESNEADGNGGAISEAGGGSVSISTSVFSKNTAASDGGAIALSDDAATLTIKTSTFSENSTGDDGGALCNSTAGDVSILNTTFSGNTAASTGGGIHNPSTGTIALSHTTITNNTANSSGGLYGFELGLIRLKSTIVIGNSAKDDDKADCGGDADGFSSEGYNWWDPETCPTLSDDDGLDVTTVPYESSLLEALADNGGPTQTHALPSRSPALKAGSCFDLDENRVTTDQRGRLRFDICNIGAYEQGPSITTRIGGALTKS